MFSLKIAHTVCWVETGSKTTLLRCITKIEKLNGGSITYSDGVKETNDYLTHIGYLPQNFEIFNELTPYEVLQFFANLKDYGITDDEINNLLKSLNLFSKKDTVVKTVRRNETKTRNCAGIDRKSRHCFA